MADHRTHSSRKKSTKISLDTYKKRAKEMRKYVNFSFDLRRKLTPARKAAITRVWNAHHFALEKKVTAKGLSFQYGFVPLSSAKLRAVAAYMFHESAVTGKGVFLKLPSVWGQKKIQSGVDKNGNIYICVGNQRFTYVPINRPALAANPSQEIGRVLSSYQRTSTLFFGIFGRPIKRGFDVDSLSADEMLNGLQEHSVSGAALIYREFHGKIFSEKPKSLDDGIPTSYILIETVKRKRKGKND